MRVIGIIITIVMLFRGEVVYAKEVESYDYTQIQTSIEQSLETDSIKFSDLVDKLVNGDTDNILQFAGEYIIESLMKEIKVNKNAIIQIGIIAVIASICSKFSTIFKNSQISEISFYVTYLTMIILLAKGVQMCIDVTVSMLQAIVSFMKALTPAYFTAVAFVGGATSSMIYSQLTIAIITGVQYILTYGILPMIRIYIVIMFVNCLEKEDFLSKTGELCQTVIQWIVKTLSGTVLGVSMIQSLILPFIDGTRLSAVHKAVRAIPGIGSSIYTISDLVIGGGIVIKNGIGVAALIIIIILTVIPMIQLGTVNLLYAASMAIIQPLGEERVVDCINTVVVGTRLLLKTVFIAGFLFFITIAIICFATNIGYFSM